MVVVGCWPDSSLALGEWAPVVGFDYKLYHKVVVIDNYLNFGGRPLEGDVYWHQCGVRTSCCVAQTAWSAVYLNSAY